MIIRIRIIHTYNNNNDHDNNNYEFGLDAVPLFFIIVAVFQLKGINTNQDSTYETMVVPGMNMYIF
jgi:hypothetical protein